MNKRTYHQQIQALDTKSPFWSNSIWISIPMHQQQHQHNPLKLFLTGHWSYAIQKIDTYTNTKERDRNRVWCKRGNERERGKWIWFLCVWLMDGESDGLFQSWGGERQIVREREVVSHVQGGEIWGPHSDSQLAKGLAHQHPHLRPRETNTLPSSG